MVPGRYAEGMGKSRKGPEFAQMYPDGPGPGVGWKKFASLTQFMRGIEAIFIKGSIYAHWALKNLVTMQWHIKRTEGAGDEKGSSYLSI